MLDERPAHARCLLRAKRNVPAAAINEVVHLLGDDVGRLSDPGKDADVLQDWRNEIRIPTGSVTTATKALSKARLRAASSPRRSRIPGEVRKVVTRRGYRSTPIGPGDRSVGVVHRVDRLDPVDDGLELRRIRQLELEAHLGHPITAGERLTGEDVDVVV